MELIGISEVAELAGVSRSAVTNWRARHDDFPQSSFETSAGPVFRREEILHWLTNRSRNVTKTISFFNNKGGVGKTTILWNVAASLRSLDKKVLLIDFDPQCNLSIAVLGEEKFSTVLKKTTEFPQSQTIRAFALPFVQMSRTGNVYSFSSKCEESGLEIVPGDFWLNNFSDVLNVGTDVIGGSGLYRFLTPSIVSNEISRLTDQNYDFVLIDLPPSFNGLVRSALYCSDYFVVPCTSDRFSAYCVSLIGEVLPNFIADWDQGKRRFESANGEDSFVTSKGMPKFAGWIFNGFDMRKKKGDDKSTMVGADRNQYEAITESVNRFVTSLQSGITEYNPIAAGSGVEPIGLVEDLNVMAPDSLVQNIPIRYLKNTKPTNVNKRSWASNQIDLMDAMDAQYTKVAQHLVALP